MAYKTESAVPNIFVTAPTLVAAGFGKFCASVNQVDNCTSLAPAVVLLKVKGI